MQEEQSDFSLNSERNSRNNAATADVSVSDTRERQAVRVADYLHEHPASTLKEIDAVCDTGCVSKVLSEMRSMGYDIKRGWRDVRCMAGGHVRRVRTYVLLGRPYSYPDLFERPLY